MALDIKSLDLEMSEIGFARIGNLIYRAPWSNDVVEHCVRLYFWGDSHHQRLAGYFSASNQESEIFARTCWIDEVGAGRGIELTEVTAKCDLICFSLGNLGRWEPRDSIQTWIEPESEVLRRIRQCVSTELRRLTGEISTLERLFYFLLGDTGVCRWMYSNAAIRAAECAYLGAKVGMKGDTLKEMIEPFRRRIDAALGSGNLNANDYVRRIVNRALLV